MPSDRKGKELTPAVEGSQEAGSSFLESIRSGLSRVISLLPKQDWIVAGWSVGIKLLLFLLAAKSFPVLWDKHQTWRELLYNWNRWDAWHYQRIAEVGYSAMGVTKAFYPLYPWTIRVVALVTQHFFAAALIVSAISLVAAVVVFRRLVQIDYPTGVALRSVWFLLIFPTAYFLHTAYSESLFLAFALGCILAARREQWWLAGVVGAFCWMTRAPGAVLVPTLLMEAAQQYWTRRRWNWNWLFILLVPLGFVVYLLINWHVSGDPFAFLKTRKVSFVQTFAWPTHGIREAIGNTHRNPNQGDMVGFEELYFVAIGLIFTVISWFKLRPLYSVWMTGNLLLFTSVSFLQSVPRYTLTMFPIFMILALWTRNRFCYGVITVFSIFFLALFSILFTRGWWAF